MKFHCRNDHDWESEAFQPRPWERNCPECGSPALDSLSAKTSGPGLRKDPEPVAVAEAHARFSQLVTEWPCFFKDRVDGKRRRPAHRCWGPTDPHHAVPASWIKDNYQDLSEIELAEILYAPIIGVPLCRQAHQEVESRSDYIYFEELDDELIEFVRAVDLKYPARPSMLERLKLESPPLDQSERAVV